MRDGWYEAIFRRTSRRRYSPSPPDPSLLDSMESFCAEFLPWPSARSMLVRQTPEGVFEGILKTSYGKITGARAFLAFVGEEGLHAEVGYTGEGAILEATRLGLDTCWVSGFFDPQAASRYVSLGSGERVYAVSPVGHAPERAGAGERAMRRLARSESRLPVVTIAPGVLEAAWPAWAMMAVEAARSAPSGGNGQPWRFRLDGGSLVVRAEEKGGYRAWPTEMRRLDCGIAMLHVEVAAREAGVRGDWEWLPYPDVARFRPTEAGEDTR